MTHPGTVSRSLISQRLKRIAPFLLLGPITGPLVAGVVLNIRDRNWVLAGMYAVLTVELTLATPILTAALLRSIR
jgi:hypothetical protein